MIASIHRTAILPSIGIRRHRLTLTDRPGIRRLARPVTAPVVVPARHRGEVLSPRWRHGGTSWGSAALWAVVMAVMLWIVLR